MTDLTPNFKNSVMSIIANIKKGKVSDKNLKDALTINLHKKNYSLPPGLHESLKQMGMHKAAIC